MRRAGGSDPIGVLALDEALGYEEGLLYKDWPLVRRAGDSDQIEALADLYVGFGQQKAHFCEERLLYRIYVAREQGLGVLRKIVGGIGHWDGFHGSDRSAVPVGYQENRLGDEQLGHALQHLGPRHWNHIRTQLGPGVELLTVPSDNMQK